MSTCSRIFCAFIFIWQVSLHACEAPSLKELCARSVAKKILIEILVGVETIDAIALDKLADLKQYRQFLETNKIEIDRLVTEKIEQMPICGDLKVYLLEGLKPIHRAIAKNQCSFFIDKRGQVYVCGDNRCGRLGLSGKEIIDVPTLVFIGTEKISEVVSQDEQTFFLSSSGGVYACGNNKDGRLGLGDLIKAQTPTPILLPLTPGQGRVSSIYAWPSHTFLLTTEGQLFAFGSNHAGRLGLGHEGCVKAPCLVKLPDPHHRVIAVISQDNDSLFLTKAGHVYACGENNHGRLGLGDAEKRVSPTMIEHKYFHDQVVRAALFFGGSYFLTAGGLVYRCGYSVDDNEEQHIPADLDFGTIEDDREKIIDIVSDGEIVFFLSDSGSVFVLGFFNRNILTDSFHPSYPSPTKLTVGAETTVVKKIIINNHRIFFLTSGWDVYACGCNPNGQLGLGSKSSIVVPTMIDKKRKIKGKRSISIGKEHGFIHTRSGNIYVFGNNDKHQLGMPQKQLIKPRDLLNNWWDRPYLSRILPLKEIPKRKPDQP